MTCNKPNHRKQVSVCYCTPEEFREKKSFNQIKNSKRTSVCAHEREQLKREERASIQQIHRDNVNHITYNVTSTSSIVCIQRKLLIDSSHFFFVVTACSLLLIDVVTFFRRAVTRLLPKSWKK